MDELNDCRRLAIRLSEDWLLKGEKDLALREAVIEAAKAWKAERHSFPDDGCAERLYAVEKRLALAVLALEAAR